MNQLISYLNVKTFGKRVKIQNRKTFWRQFTTENTYYYINNHYSKTP